MAKKKKVSKVKLDLDGDGDFDKDDKKIAAKALATGYDKGNESLKVKDGEMIAKVDINLTYRKGDIVPESQIKKWQLNGIKYQVWFE